MLLIFAEILLLALAPAEETSKTGGSQKVQTLLQHFYEQYYNPTESGEISGRMARTEPVFTVTNVNKQSSTPSAANTLRGSSSTTTFAHDSPPNFNLGTAARMRTSAPTPTTTTKVVTSRSGFLNSKVVRGKIVTTTAPLVTAEPRRNPEPDDTLVFLPSTGGRGDSNSNPNNNGIQDRCDHPKVFFQSKCYSLLTPGPCASQEWLVEIEGVVQCAKTKCQYPKVPLNGQCVEFQMLTYSQYQNCPVGMSINLNKDGTAECDCLPGHIYHETKGGCFKAYEQGPCRELEYFVLVPDMNVRLTDGSPLKKAACVNNPCRTDGMVCFGPSCSTPNARRNCVPLNSSCQDGKGLILVEYKELQVTCADPNNLNDVRVIGNVPSFACSQGSKRDVSGRCRKTTTMTFS